ncbi:MAG: hypothetical protein KatS3mg096_170 [Candidatus Parcubacteria bacterium]|nr:MAG: hypothetical protein KatS3mg096_170 [Candidatus Parcubacteria bacterium]
MNNHIYNLFSQLVQNRRSIYRIQKFYLKDARGCKKCLDFWKQVLKQKEAETKELINLIKAHKI